MSNAGLTPEQKALVASTWQQVVPISEQAATLFYDRLFEMDPSVKPLFKSDIKQQGIKLMQTITLAVKSLDKLDQLVPIVQELGRRHIGYGVKPEHYTTVGGALLWTLEQGLGDAFTPEVKDAWAVTYGLLSSVMIDAAAAAAE